MIDQTGLKHSLNVHGWHVYSVTAGDLLEIKRSGTNSSEAGLSIAMKFASRFEYAAAKLNCKAFFSAPHAAKTG